MKVTRKQYESPKAEVIMIETQCVLCASAGPSYFTGGSATTEDMSIVNISL